MIEQITKLYEAKRKDLVNIYRSRAGANDVEDLVQEAFYNALLYKDSYNPDILPLEGWLVCILNNCLKRLLKEKQERATLHQEPDEDLFHFIDADSEIFPIVNSEISAMKNKDHRQVVYMWFILNYNIKDISRRLEVSKASVRKICERFRNYMKETHPEYRRDCEDRDI